MSQDKVKALLKVAEEILFSISLPSHILAKYQNLRNSLLNSDEFSLKRFDSSFSPRRTKTVPAGYTKLLKVCLICMQNVLEKTFVILESQGHSRIFTYDKSFSDFLNSKEKVKDLTQISYEIEDIERKTIENLEIFKDMLNLLKNNLNILNEEIKTSRFSSHRENQADQVYFENAKILRENQELKDQIQDLKEEWNQELEKVRLQWTLGLDNMKNTYERNIQEMTENHEVQLSTLQKVNMEKIAMSKEIEQKLIEKLENITIDQKEVLYKLNEKITFLTQVHNEDNSFIEKVMKKVDGLFEKFDLIDKEYVFTNMKEKINSKLEDLEIVLEKNRMNIVKCTKADVKKHLEVLKEKLFQSHEVRKEFEEARTKLVKYFEESPSLQKSLTTRY